MDLFLGRYLGRVEDLFARCRHDAVRAISTYDVPIKNKRRLATKTTAKAIR